MEVVVNWAKYKFAEIPNTAKQVTELSRKKSEYGRLRNCQKISFVSGCVTN